MVENLTLYTARICPYAQRAELALEEAGAQYKRYEIDLQNKPEWYAPKVNPASKVPAIAYGGPDVPPDQPSPDSTKIAESLVLLEFFADLYPNSTLLPKDPIARAQIRFFIDAVSTKLQPSWYGFIAKGESPEALYKAYDDIQSLIRGNFAVGNQFTIADAAILPFLARIEISLENDIGAYPEGDGLKALKELKSPEYSKIQAYYEGLKSRNSFQKTFNAELVKEVFGKRFGALRAQKQAA